MRSKAICLLLLALCGAARVATAAAVAPVKTADKPATFTLHSAHNGNWSDAATWAEGRAPRAGDLVQIRAGDAVVYDAASDDVIRMIHVAGRLSFTHDRSTRLTVGLIKIQPDDASENGFDCDAHAAAPEAPPQAAGPMPSLEIGTLEDPIPAGITATIRLAYIPGTNPETLPAIIDCGGRWDVHGAPLNRTWLKLGADAKAGASAVTLSEAVTGWHAGDHVFITSSSLPEEVGHSFRVGRDARMVQTEERTVAAIEGVTVTLDRPLQYAHLGHGDYRSEIANLSRNVVIESADPDGVRGHTMYHRRSAGGISYAEFRHLGKQGILGKYAIHFHLAGDSMRGSGVVGASIWDSANRWVTIHGTNHLLVRDCVGYGSIGHGFFLEDGTEAYNLIDRNLAVHAYRGKPLPKQVLGFDPNDGAGFWWAAACNTFVRNVTCENDHYGYHFEFSESRADLIRPIQQADGSNASIEIRAIPFYRFDNNESHCDGLYSFNFGADRNGLVHGDRTHPFICRHLLSWETHYSMRPMVQFFLLDGFKMHNSVYGVYHPDYDAHVYRNLYLHHVVTEPINRAHDDEDIQYGSFTYENLTLEDCGGTLIQLGSTSPKPDQTGHFRNVIVHDTKKPYGPRAVVDLGTGTRTTKLQNPVAYYFHDQLGPGRTLRVVSTIYPEQISGDYRAIPPFTGKDVRAAEVSGVRFPELLDPVDDLPPATMIRSVRQAGGKLIVSGVSHDNGDIVSVDVNGQRAEITASTPGVVDWQISIDAPADGTLIARATDQAGNVENPGQRIRTGAGITGVCCVPQKRDTGVSPVPGVAKPKPGIDAK